MYTRMCGRLRRADWIHLYAYIQTYNHTMSMNFISAIKCKCTRYLTEAAAAGNPIAIIVVGFRIYYSLFMYAKVCVCGSVNWFYIC